VKNETMLHIVLSWEEAIL